MALEDELVCKPVRQNPWPRLAPSTEGRPLSKVCKATRVGTASLTRSWRSPGSSIADFACECKAAATGNSGCKESESKRLMRCITAFLCFGVLQRFRKICRMHLWEHYTLQHGHVSLQWQT